MPLALTMREALCARKHVNEGRRLGGTEAIERRVPICLTGQTHQHVPQMITAHFISAFHANLVI